MKYPSGREMPDNVFAALRFIGRSGFITRELWRTFFSEGNERWCRRQIELLCNRRVIEQHPNPIAGNCFVLGCFGRILLARHGIPFVHPPYVSQLAHDELVAHSILHLSERNIVHSWHLESELKYFQLRQHQLNSSAKDQKYPDAIFKIRALNLDRLCAIEYERTRKSPQRYRDILWLYSAMESFWTVIFICENDAIASMIYRQLRYLNQPSLSSRVAFARVGDWKKDPELAPIELDGTTFTLSELRTTNDAIAA